MYPSNIREQRRNQEFFPQNLEGDFNEVFEGVEPDSEEERTPIGSHAFGNALLGAISAMGKQIVGEITNIAASINKITPPAGVQRSIHLIEGDHIRYDRSAHPPPYPPHRPSSSNLPPNRGVAEVYGQFTNVHPPPHSYQGVIHPSSVYPPPQQPFITTNPPPSHQNPPYQHTYPRNPGYPSMPPPHQGMYGSHPSYAVPSQSSYDGGRKRAFPFHHEEGKSVLSKFGQEAFIDEILSEVNPRFFKPPKLSTYIGQSDPTDHVSTFQDELTTYTVSDFMKCRLFLMTLKGEARQWFSTLPPRSIYCFDQFIANFLGHFSSARKPQRSTDVLHAIRQGSDETLRSYINRFLAVQNTVTNLVPDVAKSAIKMGLQDGLFKHSLSINPPPTMDALLERAWKYINAEEEKDASRSILS